MKQIFKILISISIFIIIFIVLGIIEVNAKPPIQNIQNPPNILSVFPNGKGESGRSSTGGSVALEGLPMKVLIFHVHLYIINIEPM